MLGGSDCFQVIEGYSSENRIVGRRPINQQNLNVMVFVVG
jgi:hypothetical protein